MHLKKDRSDASIYQKHFIEIREMYHDYIPVYTDGSRDGNYVTCASLNHLFIADVDDPMSLFTSILKDIAE